MSRDTVHRRHQEHSNGLATIRPRGHYRSSAYVRAEKDRVADGEDEIFFSLRHASSDSRFYWPSDVNDNVQKSLENDNNGAIYDTPCLIESKRAKRSNTLRSFRKPRSIQTLYPIHVTVPDCGSILEYEEGNGNLPPTGRTGGWQNLGSSPHYGTIIRMRTKSESQEGDHGPFMEWERKYSTLGNIRKNRETTREINSSCHSLNYFDPLDFKIGCQSTLRSKPQIPWYELAIRQNNRRLSCPPLDDSNDKVLIHIIIIPIISLMKKILKIHMYFIQSLNNFYLIFSGTCGVGI